MRKKFSGGADESHVPQKDMQNVIMLAGIGLVIKMFFGKQQSTDGLSGPATAALWGYGIIIVSLFLLLFINLGLENPPLAYGELKQTPGFNAIKKIAGSKIASAAPPIIMIIIISLWLLIMNFNYYEIINEGKVATEFNQFSNASSVLILLQLGVLAKYMFYILEILKTPKENQNIDKQNLQKQQYSSILSVLFVINLGVLSVMQVIITYFSTDG